MMLLFGVFLFAAAYGMDFRRLSESEYEDASQTCDNRCEGWKVVTAEVVDFISDQLNLDERAEKKLCGTIKLPSKLVLRCAGNLTKFAVSPCASTGPASPFCVGAVGAVSIWGCHELCSEIVDWGLTKAKAFVSEQLAVQIAPACHTAEEKARHRQLALNSNIDIHTDGTACYLCMDPSNNIWKSCYACENPATIWGRVRRCGSPPNLKRGDVCLGIEWRNMWTLDFTRNCHESCEHGGYESWDSRDGAYACGAEHCYTRGTTCYTGCWRCCSGKWSGYIMHTCS